MSISRREFLRAALFSTAAVLAGVAPAEAVDQDAVIAKVVKGPMDQRNALKAVLAKECEASPVALDALAHLQEAGVHFRVIEDDDMDATNFYGQKVDYSFKDGLTGNYYTMDVPVSQLGTFPLIATTLNCLTNTDAKMDSYCGPKGVFDKNDHYCDQPHRTMMEARDQRARRLLAQLTPVLKP